MTPTSGPRVAGQSVAASDPVLAESNCHVRQCSDRRGAINCWKQFSKRGRNDFLTAKTKTGAQRTLRIAVSVMAFVYMAATAGFVVAGWSWIDAFYMVTITVFSVGYGEVIPIVGNGMKIYTSVVIVAGCTSLLYVMGGFVQLLTEGEIERMLGLRTLSKEIDQLKSHTIVCGYGRVGKLLACELRDQGEPFVIIERSAELVHEAVTDGHLAFDGDAVVDETLQAAGINRAKVLATVLPDDAINVFITLTARDLNNTINIIARAESPSTERKLIRSGASSVVMPAAIGAVRIAQIAIGENDARDSDDEVEILQHELADLANDLNRAVARRDTETQTQLESLRSQNQLD